MNRKTFLERLTVAGSGVLVVPGLMLQSCKMEPRVWNDLSNTDISLLNELAETILPETPSLIGAKAVNVGTYVLDIVNSCLSPQDKDTFLTGLGTIDSKSIKDFEKTFEEIANGEKLSLLTALQDEAIAFEEDQEGNPEPEVHYFSLLKELVVNGFFTSKEVMTKAFDYSPIPGRYEGCIDYNPVTNKIYKG